MLFVIVCFDFAFFYSTSGTDVGGGPGECYGKAVSSGLGRRGPCARGRRGRRRVFQRTAVEAGRGFVVRVALGPVSGQAWV